MWILKWGNNLLLLYLRGCFVILFWIEIQMREGRKKTHPPIPFMWTGIKYKANIMHYRPSQKCVSCIFCRVFLSDKICFSTRVIFDLLASSLSPTQISKEHSHLFLEIADTLEMWVLQFKKHFCWTLKAILVWSRLWIALDALQTNSHERNKQHR